MRAQFWKLILLPLIISSAIAVVVLGRSATAAPPPGPSHLGPLAQQAGVALEKKASQQTVALGQIFSYTVTIQNKSAETVNGTLTDTLPEGLVLQTASISATAGQVESDYNTLLWSGSLKQGEQVAILYDAIAPTTSSPDQSLSNVAVLEFGGARLEASATVVTQTPDLGLWGRFVNLLAVILVALDSSMRSIGIPYSFGFAIILFTVLVRLATFPLNMQQIKSSKAMQELQPKMKELQDKYKNDREKLAQEQMKLYKEHGVNPLGGCLPMLVQMPIWFALYQALLQLSTEGLLSEGFLWIPSLAGPVSDYSQGLSWLYPFVNGAPPVGWLDAIAYLVLPILLVVSQLYMQQMMTPPTTDPQQASMQQIMKFMPLMFGYFALVVPSGLSLYWFTSNLLAMLQQYFTKTDLSASPAPVGVTAGSSAAVSTDSVATNSVSTDADEEEVSKEKYAKSKRKRSRRKR